MRQYAYVINRILHTMGTTVSKDGDMYVPQLLIKVKFVPNIFNEECELFSYTDTVHPG